MTKTTLTEKEQLKLLNKIAYLEAALEESENCRKSLVDELDKQEMYYKKIFDIFPHMYTSVCADTATILYCNNKFLEELGYNRDEVIGQMIFDFYPPECLEEARDSFLSFITKGKVKDVPLKLSRKDGTCLDVRLNLRAVKDPTGKIIRSLSVWTDFSEMVTIEKKLKILLDQFQFMIDSVHLGTWEWDLNTDVVISNRNLEELFDLEEDDETSKAFFDRVHGDDLIALKESINRSLEGNGKFHHKFRVVQKNGEARNYLAHAQVIFDTNRQPLKLVGFTVDISGHA